MNKCRKVKYRSRKAAENVTPVLHGKFGMTFKVYECHHPGCEGFFHHKSRTKKRAKEESRGTGKARKRKRTSRWHYRANRLPIETWEGEGGSMDPWEVKNWYTESEVIDQ